VEQTQDDFSMVHADGIVAYSNPTSQHAKDQEADQPQTTGHK